MAPTVKKNPLDDFIPLLSRAIFHQEQVRQKAIADDLIARNALAGGSASGFIFGGRVVSNLDAKELRTYGVRPVVDELRNEALHYVEIANKLDADAIKLEQYTGSLFRRCSGIQDVRNILPDMVAADIPVISNYPRTDDMNAFVKGYPLLNTPFQGLQNIIGYYLANRLIF